MKVTFEINGRPVNPRNLKDVMEQAILEAIEKDVRSKLAGVRDPETGEFPVVTVRGRSLDNLSFEISGSPQLVALARERLGLGESDTNDEDSAVSMQTDAPASPAAEPLAPCAFLCHASEDKPLARRIAGDFQTQGIDTFFADWEIGPGDSLRQKIDAGLGRCTHFVVLLTPSSLPKPWVNAEMDAGFVRKVDGQCRFIALRHGLPSEKLPLLLSGLHSPSIENYAKDLTSLVNFIHGVTTKPPLGPAPRPVREASKGKTGLSPAAEMIARLMIERSEHGDAMDPQLEPDELRQATGLLDDDIVDAVHELQGRGFVRRYVTLASGALGFASVIPEAALFAALDQHFKAGTLKRMPFGSRVISSTARQMASCRKWPRPMAGRPAE
ncbi:MAG: toll/interleukin-1 receptor domain-containing protein [Geminicoccaceae bacterium]